MSNDLKKLPIHITIEKATLYKSWMARDPFLTQSAIGKKEDISASVVSRTLSWTKLEPESLLLIMRVDSEKVTQPFHLLPKQLSHVLTLSGEMQVEKVKEAISKATEPFHKHPLLFNKREEIKTEGLSVDESTTTDSKVSECPAEIIKPPGTQVICRWDGTSEEIEISLPFRKPKGEVKVIIRWSP